VITRKTTQRYFWIAFVAVLVACQKEVTSAVPAGGPVATPVFETPTPSAAFMSPVPFPTAGLLSTLISPTNSSGPPPLAMSTATEEFSLDNLRMAYIVDGNLYVQDGSNSPKQLSNSGKSISPMFSDDGEKIIFYHGEINDNDSVFSINADGSLEQEIITTEWLATLGVGTKAGHFAFVPNTNQILFNTYLCPKYDPSSDSGCTVGLFLVDTDTGELKEIMPPTVGGWLPIGGDALWIRNFSISPDGKLLSIAHAGQIDIFDINGKVIHRSIMPYSPGMPFELYPRVYWFSDSSGLIVTLPAETEYFGPLLGGDPVYTIWQYIFDGNVATQIPLDPAPAWIHMDSNDMISISPNREWAIYFTEDYKVHKGNLLDGSTELLLPGLYYLPMQWSSDNIHFANGANPAEPILGSVNTPPGYIFGAFIGWIDAKRFIYIPNPAERQENIQLLVGEIEEKIILSYKSNVFVPGEAPYPYFFAFTNLEGK
jgi:hypothetical protein